MEQKIGESGGTVNYSIYVDGSYRRSKKASGIGVLWIKDGKVVHKYSKGFKNGTNNIAELMAIYIALQSIIKPINSLEIVSDSEYAIGSITKDYWKPKKNVMLIDEIKNQLKLTQKLVTNPIKFRHTFGHSIDKYNNIVDSLAQEASLNYDKGRDS